MNTPSSVSFADLVLMLATMAAVHLGEVGDPVTGEMQRNLPAAGQMIDLLSVIQQKTTGNLEPDEVQLIDAWLYELRLKYIDASQDGGAAPEKSRIIMP
ncbi:MAG: DUF1844 domain-containing protein [Vicinamibacteria bacterium]|jgi:hypothetical protein